MQIFSLHHNPWQCTAGHPEFMHGIYISNILDLAKSAFCPKIANQFKSFKCFKLHAYLLIKKEFV